MTEVQRRIYLDRLESSKDRPDNVKVVTGMRRCGKTVLMRQFMDRLRSSGIPDDSIAYLNFESRSLAHVECWESILDEISARTDTSGRIYVFLDEVQRVPGWERAVNSLQTDFDADVYITGSNAYLLSSDLATYISGRYMELRMLPLSFAEFLELHPGDEETRFMQYIRTGSIPSVDPDADEAFERDHLIGLFSTVLLKDVLRNVDNGDASILEDVTGFLYSNVGNIQAATT